MYGIRWRSLAAVAATAALAVVLSGCTTSGAATDNAGASTLTIARAADASSLDLTTSFDNNSIWPMQQVMETLFNVSEDGTEVVPWLAESYTISDDGLTYTLSLRDGVTFSNGDPLTAADVKFSLDASTATGDAGWGYVNDPIASVEATDDSTVVITLKRAWAPILATMSLFANAIVPAD